jgi:hypothetical protein
MSYLKDVPIHERESPMKIYKWSLILIVIISVFIIQYIYYFISVAPSFFVTRSYRNEVAQYLRKFIALFHLGKFHFMV